MYWIEASAIAWSLLFLALGMAYFVCLKIPKERGLLREFGIAIATIIIGSIVILSAQKVISAYLFLKGKSHPYFLKSCIFSKSKPKTLITR